MATTFSEDVLEIRRFGLQDFWISQKIVFHEEKQTFMEYLDEKFDPGILDVLLDHLTNKVYSQLRIC